MTDKRKSISPSDKRKSISPTRRTSRVNVPAVRTAKRDPAAAAAAEEALLARVARAEEDLGRMLARLTHAEARAKAAEARLEESAEDRLRAAFAERDALKDAMREAATVLLRALRPGPRVAPPPLPPLPTIDISEIADMVESLRPPPHRP